MFVFKLGIKFKLLQPSRSYLVWHLPTFPTLSPPNSPPLCPTFIILQSYWPFFCSPKHSKGTISTGSSIYVFSVWNIFSQILLWLALFHHSALSSWVIFSERSFLVTMVKNAAMLQWMAPFSFFSPCFIFIHKTITS